MYDVGMEDVSKISLIVAKGGLVQMATQVYN